MLRKLKTQKEEEAVQRSLKIREKLFKLKIFKQAQVIMFYLSSRGEVQTRNMINEVIKLGKKIAVPVCNARQKLITPCWLRGLGVRDIKKGSYGIDEPARKVPVALEDIDLIVLPGIAFDVLGNRLGRGAGYYDRFLARVPKDTPKVGLAFNFQVLEHLPNCLPHDFRVNKVISA